MALSPVLRGISILMVDAQRFRCSYVSDVIGAAGGSVLGPFHDAGAALAFLAERAARPALAYVGLGGGIDTALVERLGAEGVSCTAVAADATSPVSVPQPGVLLRPPLAGFQIVEALAALLEECHGTHARSA